MNQKGCFTISLDFELHWGGFEKWNLKERESYFLNTRKAIPEMLNIFSEGKVHVTWATVGLLFANGKKHAEQFFPDKKPTYKHAELSAYEFIKNNNLGENEEGDLFHFAPSLIHLIQNTAFQEIGTHTFSHYYCNEEGQNPEQFESDLQAAINIAAEKNISLKSLVFPRNQYNQQYLAICKKLGIIAIRSNPSDWFWKIETRNESKFKRLMRGLDNYLPVGDIKTYPFSNLKKSFPVEIPSGRVLRPWSEKEKILNPLKIKRILNELEYAAKHNEIYHLWWHPHNFGYYPKQNLDDLKTIVNHFQYCQKKYGMESLSMGEIAHKVLED